MKKFEYCVYYFTPDDYGNFANELAECLNEFGRKGWELVQSMGDYLCFKREA